jgi:hypothetical protein
MIIVMKKIILIPLLILLVGCETETEFDRCFKANGGNGESLDIVLFMEEKKLSYLGEDATTIEDMLETLRETYKEKIFKSSLTASELEFDNCPFETYNERMKELEDSGMDKLDIVDNILDDCRKNRAKQICNAQGIY